RGVAVRDFLDHPELLDDPEPEATFDDVVRALTYAPVALFVLVAGADGDIDKKEAMAFPVGLATTLSVDNELVQESLVHCLQGFPALFEELVRGGPDACLHALIAVRIAASNALGADADVYCHALYTLAEDIAKASGGSLFGFGKKIGKEEQIVLDVLQKILRD
ncbi:MAG: hypothetical protein K0U93_10830, partial [Gammaproteobacteria bacterium]|nr:hypothetical protein [Gammaproteobacteria bacterium]